MLLFYVNVHKASDNALLWNICRLICVFVLVVQKKSNILLVLMNVDLSSITGWIRFLTTCTLYLVYLQSF